MNKKRNTFLIVISVILITFCIYIDSKLTSETFIDINTVSTELSITSDKLVRTYVKNEERANEMFSGKIVEIKGIVKEVSFLNNRNTVILYGEDDAYGVICDFGTNQIKEIQKLSKNDHIKIKGICKGFLKDVIVLNCLLMNTTLNE
ncbi:MAG: hypothetical protein JXQ93_05675 [Flavobacteriaceae bacterium]